MAELLEQADEGLVGLRCNLCGQGAPRRLFEREGVWLVQCRRCGLVYTHPWPAADELKHLYDDDYIRELPGGEGLETDSAWVLDPLSWEAARMQYATAGVRGRRLLEIGCATGQFLAPLKQQGWEVWGVEFNLQAAAAAARRLSATVLGGEFMSANLPQEYFDTVTLFHVIEHVLDPRKTVEKIRSVLRKNGRLVLETPDIGSRRARKLGPNWPSVKPGEHLYYFDQNSLHNLLEGAGFRVDKVRRCGGLGMLTPAQRPGGTHALKHMTFGVRRWLAPTPWLRGLARRLYWDFLRQNDCILVVASRRS